MNDFNPHEQPDDVTRSLPHAMGPEKSVLSSCLQEPLEFMARAIEANVSEADFYLPAHSTLFGVMLELFAAGIEIELVSLIQHLLDRGKLDRAGCRRWFKTGFFAGAKLDRFQREMAENRRPC